MSKSIKQVYVSLELGENDLKILVAEYFNTRFNILKIEKKETKALSDFKIVDRQQLIDDIRELINVCSNKIGAKIERVVLVLPAYNFKRFPLRSKVIPDKGIVTKKDIARAITNSLTATVDSDVMIINAMPIRYIVNEIPSRRMPEKEFCDEMLVDIDLLCADKDMTYEFVSVVEESGVKVLDITLNTFAIGKEASLFEESLKQNVICLDINRNCSYLSLFSKGKLVSTEIVYEGLNSIVEDIKLKYNIPANDIIRLMKYDVNYSSKYPYDIIYAYNADVGTISISTKQLNEAVLIPMENLVNKLVTMCVPILEQGASLFVTGEGQQMSSLIDKIKELTNCEIKSYYPDTIGVRDPSLTSIYGSLFAYKEKVELNDINVNCIDLLEYDSYIDSKEIDTEGETITTKIKNLFKQYVDKEEQ